MAPAMPDLDAVCVALDAFRAAVRAAQLDAPALDAYAVATLHAHMVRIVDDVERDRDAVLALARDAGATWERLESLSAVPDSTLRDRLTRYELAQTLARGGIR